MIAQQSHFWKRVLPKRILIGAVSVFGTMFVLVTEAAAACPTFYQLQNGQSADAIQVMSDFNYILQCPNFTGNVGIGTTSPSQNLDMESSGEYDVLKIGASVAPTIEFYSSSGSQDQKFWDEFDSGTSFQLRAINDAYSAGTVWLNAIRGSGYTISSVDFPNGKVGIGTQNPQEALDVQGIIRDNNDLEIVGQSNWNGLITKNWTGAWPFTSIGAGPTMAISFGNLNTSSDFIFYTGPVATAAGQAGAPTERVRITQAGDVGIGTSSPTATLYVNGSTVLTQGYSTTSDFRLKTNIRPLTGGMQLVQKLRPVSFYWRPPNQRSVGRNLQLPSNERQIGFIAQEVEKVVPEAVVAPKAASSGVYTLNEDKLIPVLVQAIKEQQAEIDELRRAIAARAAPDTTPTARR